MKFQKVTAVTPIKRLALMTYIIAMTAAAAVAEPDNSILGGWSQLAVLNQTIRLPENKSEQTGVDIFIAPDIATMQLKYSLRKESDHKVLVQLNCKYLIAFNGFSAESIVLYDSKAVGDDCWKIDSLIFSPHTGSIDMMLSGGVSSLKFVKQDMKAELETLLGVGQAPIAISGVTTGMELPLADVALRNIGYISFKEEKTSFGGGLQINRYYGKDTDEETRPLHPRDFYPINWEWSGYLDIIAVSYASLGIDATPTIVSVRREVQFRDNDRPNSTALMKQISDKYGATGLWQFDKDFSEKEQVSQMAGGYPNGTFSSCDTKGKRSEGVLGGKIFFPVSFMVVPVSSCSPAISSTVVHDPISGGAIWFALVLSDQRLKNRVAYFERRLQALSEVKVLQDAPKASGALPKF